MVATITHLGPNVDGLEVEIRQETPAMYNVAQRGGTKEDAFQHAREEYGAPAKGLMVVKFQGFWFMSDGVNPNGGGEYTEAQVELIRSQVEEAHIHA
jgi:hypothetical protein